VVKSRINISPRIKGSCKFCWHLWEKIFACNSHCLSKGILSQQRIRH